MKLKFVFALSALLALSLVANPVHAQKGSRSRSSSSSSSSHAGHVSVSSYTTKRGTRVESHHRSAADKTDSNNWSTIGNTNPDTGKAGTKRRRR